MFGNGGANKEVLNARYSNISALRKTNISQHSGYTKSLIGGDKPFQTLEQFLDEMFTSKFVSFTERVRRLNSLSFSKLARDEDMIKRIKSNSYLLSEKMAEQPLEFPNYQNEFPFQLREVYEYLHALLRRRDLIRFKTGNFYSEKMINMYFKILSKMNLVQLSMDNYQRQQQMLETPDGENSYRDNLLLGTTTMKIQYMNTNFVRKLLIQSETEGTPQPTLDMAQIDQHLLQYFNHDLVLLPFFFDTLDQNPTHDNHKHLYQRNT